MPDPSNAAVLAQQEEAGRLRAFACYTVKLLYSQIFERRKQGGPENERMAGEFQGVLEIMCQELRLKCGIEVILPQPGETFDPRLHAALGQEEHQDKAPGCVVRTVSPGFLAGGKVTYAQVIVSNQGEATR